MVINGLNSGARVYMADFEDSTSPTWANLIQGQVNLKDAVRGTIAYTAPNGKSYRLNDGGLATLFVRPRGLHLDEAHVTVNGQPVAGGLFDLAVYLVHNAVPLLAKGSGPYHYLPKMESHHEARWWADVMKEVEEYLALPRGTVRATALIETITAAFEMEEILFELREHSLGLNCGRWDYIFSYIKNLKAHPEFVTPDRQHLTMTCPFMAAYVSSLIRICHSRGTFAMGGMAAQIPVKGPDAAKALEAVKRDKEREVQAGHDGTWVAHPGLISVALAAFDAHMRTPNQIHVVPEATVTADDLLAVPKVGSVTLAGLRDNVNVLLEYTRAWLSGVGCIPLNLKMEDAATAEIARVQIYQWVRHGARTAEDGQPVTKAVVAQFLQEEADTLVAGATTGEERRALALARVLVGRMLLEHQELDAFLTTVCYPYIVSIGAAARL
jgi:malate synthase